MNDIEKKEALVNLEAILKATPPGLWEIRSVASALKILVQDADAKPAEVARASDKPSARTSKG